VASKNVAGRFAVGLVIGRRHGREDTERRNERTGVGVCATRTVDETRGHVFERSRDPAKGDKGNGPNGRWEEKRNTGVDRRALEEDERRKAEDEGRPRTVGREGDGDDIYGVACSGWSRRAYSDDIVTEQTDKRSSPPVDSAARRETRYAA